MPYIGKEPARVPVTASDIPDDSITAAKIVDGAITIADIADDAVTEDKLANAINTAIAANTAKTTNATHTGEVTGSGALTITADAITGAKIADDAVESEHIAAGAVDDAHLATGITASKLTGALPAISGANLTGITAADNTPAFSAYLSSDQAIAHATYTTIAYDSELVDTDNCFSTSTYRFTPTTAGYYFVSSTIFFGGQVADKLFLNVIFKNSGSDVVARSVSHISFAENTANTTSGVVHLNGSSDFVYTQIKHTTDATKNAEANKTIFSGFKLAGV